MAKWVRRNLPVVTAVGFEDRYRLNNLYILYAPVGRTKGSEVTDRGFEFRYSLYIIFF